VTCRQCQEGTCLDGIFLVGRRSGGDGAALLGDVLGVSDLGEGADVVEAVGDLLDGYEGEDAWEMVSGADRLFGRRSCTEAEPEPVVGYVGCHREE